MQVKEPSDGDGTERDPMLRIQLSDGKVRALQSMNSTYFYVDGKPLSAEEFLKRLFDIIKLPELLGSEQELVSVQEIRTTFIDFQQYLYEETAG